MSELAVKIEHVSKQYRLGAIGGGTLKGDLQTWMAKMRGKEDPNSKIGAAVYTKNEKFLALDDINLEIKKGEAVGIIGHNGAGKSTLLKLITRVTAPTTGNIYLNGRVASMLEVGTGFHPELSGRDNVYLNGAILGMNKSEIKDKFEEIVEFSEVRQFIDTPVKRYSSGMYVKLAFSVAAHLDSEIMIMDEVLAVGDVKFQQKCLDKMSEAAHKDGRTVLYVSHNMNTIRRLCDRCIVMEHGSIVFDGDVDEAISIYMGKKSDIEQKKVFTEEDHSQIWYDTSFVVNSVHLMNDINAIKNGDVLNFNVKYTAKKDLADLRMRLVVVDEHFEIVGMAVSEEMMCFSKGEIGEYQFEFDTKHLSMGKYTTKFSIFEINKFGAHEYHCVLNDFFPFSLQDNPNSNFNMNWDIRSWGHIPFPHIKTKLLKRSIK